MNAQEMKVLLVEDNLNDAEFVQAALAEHHGIRFTVAVAPRLLDAIAQLHQAKMDAILLDLGLPDSHGLLTLQQLYQVCGSDTAIVVVTATEDESLGTQALQLGAQDYLSKKHITNGRALTRCLRYGYERKQREVLERQLIGAQRGFEVARTIQQHLLPKQAPQLPPFDIAGVCCPTEATGGDFFDFVPVANGRLGIVLADVASHGFGPALIMASTRRALRSIARTNSDPGSIMTLVNEAVCEDTDAERFVTLFLACLDPDRTLLYAGAGHNAHLFDADGKVTTLGATGLPLGVINDSTYATGGPTAFEPGYLLLLVSDGFHETYQVRDCRPVGISAVLDYVHSNRHLSAKAIVEGLVETVQRFCYPGHPDDDMTVVVVKSSEYG